MATAAREKSLGAGLHIETWTVTPRRECDIFAEPMLYEVLEAFLQEHRRCCALDTGVEAGACG